MTSNKIQIMNRHSRDKSAHMQRGFTLIELLVVIAIMGIFSSVVLSSLAPAREKARDAKRLQDLNSIRTALELYYEANGQYPALRAYTTTDNCGFNWCVLETTLAPYLSVFPRDPSGPGATYVYYYDANSGDNFQSFGLMMRFESLLNEPKASTDGGFYAIFYEIGSQPIYCMQKYGGSDPLNPDINGRWWPTTPSSATVCFGGN